MDPVTLILAKKYADTKVGAQANLAATAAPAVGNDNTEGYAPGSLWVDTTNKKAYVCTDATTGAAIWEEYTGLETHKLQEASDTILGHVTVDGSTITAAGGVISAADVPNKVDKSGDTITGTLAMSGETGITFGGKFKLVYNDTLTTLDIEVIP